MVLGAMVAFNSCEKYSLTYTINDDKCSLCKECIAVCGQHAISYIDSGDSIPGKMVIDPDKCMGCGKCINACSTNAIHAAE